MRSVCVAVAAVALVILIPSATASAQVRHSCGNYGHTEGGGDRPVFTMLKFRFGA
jgi:hypothetical protein